MVDRIVEVLFLIFTGVSVSYWGPFMYTFAIACPVFAFLFGFASKFASSNNMKSTLFNLYVICLYTIAISMVVQWMNQSIWFGLLSLPGYSTLANNFPELFRPALSAIALYLPLTTVPKLFDFLYKKVNDTRLLQESIWDYGGIKLSAGSKDGTGAYSCEMFICMNKETGAKEIIPEQSRFNQFLVVGPSGTGKTWIGKMIATTACSKALRVKWIEFPDLYEELSRLYSSLEKQTLSSRLAYYSRFDLLCIDEFPSVSNMNSMLVQQIFNVLYKSHCSLLICTQMNPDKIDCVFDNGLGESIRGRILERAKRLKVDGEDLRLHESLIH